MGKGSTFNKIIDTVRGQRILKDKNKDVEIERIPPKELNIDLSKREKNHVVVCAEELKSTVRTEFDGFERIVKSLSDRSDTTTSENLLVYNTYRVYRQYKNSNDVAERESFEHMIEKNNICFLITPYSFQWLLEKESEFMEDINSELKISMIEWTEEDARKVYDLYSDPENQLPPDQVLEELLYSIDINIYSQTVTYQTYLVTKSRIRNVREGPDHTNKGVVNTINSIYLIQIFLELLKSQRKHPTIYRRSIEERSY